MLVGLAGESPQKRRSSETGEVPPAPPDSPIKAGASKRLAFFSVNYCLGKDWTETTNPVRKRKYGLSSCLLVLERYRGSIHVKRHRKRVPKKYPFRYNTNSNTMCHMMIIRHGSFTDQFWSDVDAFFRSDIDTFLDARKMIRK